MVFTNEEVVDMLLIYGEYFQNAKQAEQRHSERFPKRRHPTVLPSVILLVDFERLED